MWKVRFLGWKTQFFVIFAFDDVLQNHKKFKNKTKSGAENKKVMPGVKKWKNRCKNDVKSDEKMPILSPNEIKNKRDENRKRGRRVENSIVRLRRLFLSGLQKLARWIERFIEWACVFLVACADRKSAGLNAVAYTSDASSRLGFLYAFNRCEEKKVYGRCGALAPHGSYWRYILLSVNTLYAMLRVSCKKNSRAGCEILTSRLLCFLGSKCVVQLKDG